MDVEVKKGNGETYAKDAEIKLLIEKAKGRPNSTGQNC